MRHVQQRSMKSLTWPRRKSEVSRLVRKSQKNYMKSYLVQKWLNDDNEPSNHLPATVVCLNLIKRKSTCIPVEASEIGF